MKKRRDEQHTVHEFYEALLYCCPKRRVGVVVVCFGNKQHAASVYSTSFSGDQWSLALDMRQASRRHSFGVPLFIHERQSKFTLTEALEEFIWHWHEQL